jgi:hypothetical protein
MRSMSVRLAILAIAAVFTGASAAHAQNAPLKGRWIFTLDTPAGRIPVPARFKVGGDGEMSFPNDVPLVYREDGATFSISVEVPRADSPNGQPFTMILRGAKSTDNAASGTLLIITDILDPARPPADPIRVVVATGAFTATRE